MRLLFALLVPIALIAQDSTVQMLDRLSKNPADHEAIQSLAGEYDLRTVDAFRKAFPLVTDPEDKLFIAGSLIDNGVKDRQYMDYLTELAEKEIASDAPEPLELGPDGKGIQGKVSAAFEEWCRKHDRNADSCLAEYYPRAVMMLAALGDQRAGDTLMRGLRSKNLVIFLTSVGGLGAIGRKDALPVIAERIAALPADAALGVACMLGPYHDARADLLMDLYIPNKEMEDRVKQLNTYGVLLQRRKERGIE